MLACTSIPSAPVSSTLQALSVSKSHKTSDHGSILFRSQDRQARDEPFLAGAANAP